MNTTTILILAVAAFFVMGREGKGGGTRTPTKGDETTFGLGLNFSTREWDALDG